MNRLNKIHNIKIKIDGFPIKQKLKTNWNAYISFISGALLTVSESLPFIDNKYNGIVQSLSKIQKEYKDDFK